MNKKKTRYRLHDLWLNLSGRSGAIHTACVDALEHYRFREVLDDARQASIWTVDIDPATGVTPAVPPESDFVSNVLGDVAFRRSGSVLYLDDTTMRAWIEPDVKHVTVGFLPQASAEDVAASFGVVLLMLLEIVGYHAVHGAALAAEDGRGVLLIASARDTRGAISQRLVEAGWTMIAMDSVLLSARDNVVVAFPFASVLQRDPEDEWTAKVDAKVLPSVDGTPSCLPQVLLYPFLEDSEHSRLGAVSRAEALVRLMSQSLMSELDRDLASRQMEVLSQTVHQANNFVLLAGRDLDEIPDAVRQLSDAARRST